MTGRALTKRSGGAERERRRRGGRLRGFLLVLEHELRTPLASSLLQLAAAEATLGGTGAAPAALAAVATAARQLRRLSLIVRRAIQIETREDIDLFPQRVDLGALAADVVDRWREGALGPAPRLELKTPAPLVGDWDPVAVEQILENLVTNALKFGQGAPVVVTVGAGRGGARLSVKDEGLGIATRDRDRIFGRFARAPSARGVAGLGIGLWVVRHLIDAHGGRVLVRSRPGKGTAIDVWLPELTR